MSVKYTDKQKDKFSREIESDIQTRLGRFDGASQNERAEAELDTANKYLKNCEKMDDFTGLKAKPSKKSDVSSENAEKFFDETQRKFRQSVNQLRQSNPEKKPEINKKLYSVGIAFDSNGKAING